MKNGKIVAGVAVMLVLGALGFWALAEVVQFRMQRPLPAAPGLSPTGKAEPLQLLRQGVRDSVLSARAALARNDKTAAAESLDGARRAAEVGRDMGEPGLAAAYEQIQQARLEMQNGKVVKARGTLLGASEALEGPVDSSGLTPPAWEAYSGATLLDPRGARIGTLETVNGAQAELIIGGKQNLLGFIQGSAGHRMEVPTARLVLGRARTLGPTRVVLTGSPGEGGG